MAPKLSLGSDILIGSSGSESSTLDFIEVETKSVGLSLNKSMSTLTFLKQSKNSACNVLRHNKRPASSFKMAKLHSVRTGCIPNYW